MLDTIDPAAPASADRADVVCADSEQQSSSVITRPAQPREPRILAEYLWLMSRTTRDDARGLMRHGVPIRAITAVCPSPARIALDCTGERYWLDDAGESAWVFPVCSADPPGPEAIETSDPAWAISIGPVIDLLAFHPGASGRWALRLGNAVVLGTIEPQYFDPEPVAVHRDITDWLRAECRGIVLLTREPIEAARILRKCMAIEAEDEAHAAALRRLLKAPEPTWPAISVRAPCRAAA
jgi:hypothetical protein